MHQATTLRFGNPFLRMLLLVGVAIVGIGRAEAAGTLKVIPDRVVLRGSDSVQQLVVERTEKEGDRPNFVADATMTSLNPEIAAIDASGMISAKGDGSTTIRVVQEGDTIEVTVGVSDFASGAPINFTNQVVPIFSKLGCNSGGCHGKSSGQNGFRLSLLGFEPTLDYETIVKEGRGRRLFPAAPDQSLLLTKAVAKVPHGGGRKMNPDSHEYRVIRRWIASGMPFGRVTDPQVDRIEIYPEAEVLNRGNGRQILVTAQYTDGTSEDVTRWAQYQSNDTDVAIVADGGMIATQALSGQAAIMARYQGKVAVYRATVPLGKPIESYPDFPTTNPVDAASLPHWKALGIVPSNLSTDAEFIRRASIDITGTLPSAKDVQAFVAESDPDKRPRLIDRVLESPDYASYFATKWADILRNKRYNDPTRQHGTFTFHDWIRENLNRNVPFDKFTRDILAAGGTPETAPAVQWYRQIKTADGFVDDAAQVFLGMRLQCAKCHHHPYEKWGQDDYYGFAAFFAKVGRKPSLSARRDGRNDEVIFASRKGSVVNPKTGQTMDPKGLGSEALKLPEEVDPRQKLVDWMADPKNPYFSRAVANRYWAHFFGRGIVEPLDDLRQTNPPTNPELLDALADGFIKSGYDLKQLIRTICNSRTYGLSSVPTETNAKDKQSFARHYPKRLNAEVLLDAISVVSGSSTAFGGFPGGTRAIELPDESVVSNFLDTFGRPKRDTACECERVTDPGLGQSLSMLNSVDVQSKLAAPGSRAEALVKDVRPEDQKIEELFWTAFARGPSSGESVNAIEHVTKHPDKRREAYEDLLWALINAKEFLFND